MPLHPSPEGFISVLDALVRLLKIQFSKQLESLYRKQKPSIDGNIARLGAKFPDGFVESALRDPRCDGSDKFISIELLPEFRELCASTCFTFQEFIANRRIYIEGYSIVDQLLHRITHKEFRRLTPHEFCREYISTRGFIANFRVHEAEFSKVIKLHSGVTIVERAKDGSMPPMGTKKVRGRPPEKTNAVKERLRKLPIEEFAELQTRTEEASASDYGVSRATFRRAYADVEREKNSSVTISDNS